MQRKLAQQRRSELEEIKDAGLVLDFDEIARKGAMSAEEKQISKWYGVYSSRQKGDHMIRVVIPGGVLSAPQARALGAMAERYSPGIISFTTRQSAQFHKVQLADIAPLLRDLRAVGLTSWHGCGDVGRNVAACPWASICQYRRLDVLPYARAVSKRLGETAELNNLPRKFKVNFSGCGGDCGQPHINCVGATAIRRRSADGGTEGGFRVVIGGGMGWDPYVAKPLYAFVPADRIVELAHAVGLLFRDRGDRFNRAVARLKVVVDRLGIDRCRELIEANLDEMGVAHGDFVVDGVEDIGPAVPDRPLRVERPVATDGGAIQRVMVPKGELSAGALMRLSELAEIYADKQVYSTNRQNLELHGIAPARVDEVRVEIAKLGFQTERFFGLDDVVACVGTTYCPLAVSATREMFDRLQPVIRQERFDAIRDRVLVNITGCPNSCSPYYIADIGMRGLRIRRRDGEGSDEGYQIRVGGTQTRFGEVLGEYKSDDCPRVVETILDTFLKVGQFKPNPGPESLAECVQRAGLDPFSEAVAALGIDYDRAPNPTEYTVWTGLGSGHLDRKTIAKDVPCQHACPAKTNVPEYIRLIAEGDEQGAYLVNQEDNVFPGVLGRVCTRPCEPACRHMWTNVQGPVRICHLKRSAADGKQADAPKPLPAWFGPSGKRLALVGGGPAGLTAARELKRYGHDVELFEREDNLGGMLYYGIPHFRLPRQVVAEEIAAIVDSGIDVQLGTEVLHEDLVAMLDSGRYDAVLVAAGTTRPRTLHLPGMPEGMAIEGLHFMRSYNLGDGLDIRGPVVVVGGGFTAIDCARSAKRILGPEADVSIIYRRGEEQMSATPDELREVREEGVFVDTMAAPVGVRLEEGKLAGVLFRRNLLGPPEPGQTKPSMVAVPASDYEVAAATLIFAIGQEPSDEVLPPHIRALGPHTTTHERLFLAGDFALGAEAIIDAVADGKAAADEIDHLLTGEHRRRVALSVREADDTGRLRDWDLLRPAPMPTLPPDRRTNEAEVETGFGADATANNARRCYLCSYKYEIDQDKCIHCDWCIKVSPRRCILRLSHLETDADGAPVKWTEVSPADPSEATYIWINSDECIRCGNCIRACPTYAISLRKADLTTECGPGGEER